jgi:hypothetical protein
MYQIFTKTILFFALFIPVSGALAQSATGEWKYRNNQEVQASLKALQAGNPAVIDLHKIAVSPGGRELTVVEIGKDQSDGPAVFVAANFDGITPLATEGALHLARYLMDHPEFRTNVRWYILPAGNPDAAGNFFRKPLLKSSLNAMEVNLDTDDQTNEDGYEDLNGDGFITMMRKKVPDGEYRISDEDPRLLVKADPAKSEKGIYKLYSEGIDNDGDGLYNEDEPGGVNPGINFPHEFRHFVKEAGLYPGQAPETYGVMKFIYDHPEIVMTINFGESNLLMDLPQEGKSDFDPTRIRIPERLARQTGLSPAQTYTMEQLIQAVSARFPDTEVTENMILAQLTTGPEKNFRKNDLVFYESLSKSYKEALKSAGLPVTLKAPVKPANGSFELWSYFHLGVPSVALSLWAPEIKRDTTAAAAPASPAARPGISSQEKKPSAEKQLLDYFDRQGINGFAAWQSFNHPQLGEVEIGGFIPYASNTPPAAEAEKWLKGQIPFVASLAHSIPDIGISGEQVTALGAGVYRLELFIENKSPLPYPTDMGIRNQQPAPVILSLEGNGITIVEGQARTPITSLGGNQTSKVSFVIHAPKPGDLRAKLESPVIRNQSRSIRIGN